MKQVSIFFFIEIDVKSKYGLCFLCSKCFYKHHFLSNNFNIMLSFMTHFSNFMTMKWRSEVTQSCLTLCDPMDCSLPGSSIHCFFPGKNTGVGCHFLLQGIFLTQGLNQGLLYYRHTPQCLSHQGSHIKVGQWDYAYRYWYVFPDSKVSRPRKMWTVLLRTQLQCQQREKQPPSRR